MTRAQSHLDRFIQRVVWMGLTITGVLVFGVFGPAQNPALVTLAMQPQSHVIGGNFSITFTQPAGVSGITYSARWRPDLAAGSWLPVPDTGTGNVHIFSVAISPNPRIFMQLTVSVP